jgi:SAM-dependent methyltransferase
MTRSRPRRIPLTASNADKHALYEESVQDPEFVIAMVTRVFRGRFGRRPLCLREDFSGTALVCAEWVRSGRDRTAVGVDLDARVLSWGRAHNLARLGEDAHRMRLVRADVLEVETEPSDAVLALNYSYCVFKQRAQLVRYFGAVRRALRPDGLFLLDCFGGQEGTAILVERRRHPRFTYEWEQARFNPIDGSLLAWIHFAFRDGSRLDRAFTYDWRHWSLPELRDALAEAGFPRVDVLWEGATPDGKGDGRFRRRVKVEDDPRWNAYLAAFTR